MINNNPYNIPQKKPLSQSKIFSDINNTRHSSTHMQNRPSNDIMYNSSIFMKNSAIMNHQSEPSFFEPIREPLSPHSKYTKQPQSVQFLPPYTNNNINVVPMRPPQNNYFPINSSKDLNFERTLNDLRQKIDGLQKKVQMQDKDRKNAQVNDPQNKKSTFPIEVDSLIVKIQDNVINSERLKQVISSIFDSQFESHTKPIWQKVKDLDESMSYSTNGASSEKLSRLQESFLRSQSQKLHEQQFMSRIKTIQKTIREMGEDIHLVNDKEEGLSVKIENELPWLRNEVKVMKVIQKKLAQSETRNSQLKQQIDQLVKKIKSIESTIQSNIMGKIKQFQSKTNNLDMKQPYISRSFDKYPSQPIILKYLQKFQVSKNVLNKNSMVNSRQKQIVEEITINQMTYYIDQDGYLLDKDCYYLINSLKGDRVRLSPAHLKLLKQKNILI